MGAVHKVVLTGQPLFTAYLHTIQTDSEIHHRCLWLTGVLDGRFIRTLCCIHDFFVYAPTKGVADTVEKFQNRRKIPCLL